MIAYVKCSTCSARDRLLVSKLKSLGFEVRDVRKNRQWRIEAREYEVPLPFWVKDGNPERIVL